MKPTRSCIRTATKFSTGVQFSHDYFYARKTSLWLFINRNSATIVMYFY